MRTTLADLLSTGKVLLADGATGTNYFAAGLASGEPPEFWNFDNPDRVRALHWSFVGAGADLILTNTFGCNAHRLKLHNAQDRVFELAKRAAELASEVAAACERKVVVAGSVGPTGELFEPMGALTESVAVASFAEQIRGLQAGGADVVWIETMSSIEEVRAAALAAIEVGMPYTATCSFDTAGRTMMGLHPGSLATVFDGLAVQPLGFGANCGVGASDILVSLLHMADSAPDANLIVKGNCGVPQFRGHDIVYSGTPELMGRYAGLAASGGARIVGGCCGTSPDHLRQMRYALDGHTPGGPRPTVDEIVTATGPLTNADPNMQATSGRERSGRRRLAS